MTAPRKWRFRDTPPVFRTVALAEAVTWTLLLIGMFLKYVTKTTDLLVTIGGGLHGFVFLAYIATTLMVSWTSGGPASRHSWAWPAPYRRM
ncbi:DUF3817 domain-containing protein [Ornithinimicrobium sp. INDO-MA30-4]|uniref:DUF3817 domain-containing protein n=1 Tax=Ornithinimicrobium sp. INDO-MA30-4 TaxID=2908651 RepID=UPI002882F637|nr:DUF3817 domain-containing protein [Ornithinimicrobium sp. INDO-MA30-4]